MTKATRFVRLMRWVVVGGVLAVLAGMFGLSYLVKNTRVPLPNEISMAQATIFYYDDGKTELGRIGEANRVSVEINQIPVDTQHAVLAAEDRTFYQHGGFSIRGISRAIVNNVLSSSTQGGSTITQQYAKNAYLSDERRFKRKIKELVLSIKLETVASKDQILADYLNTIFFGRGAYGIETASNAYFGKQVQNLTVEESAVLASIIQAPNNLAPEDHLDALKARWNYTLDGMVDMGWLDKGARASMKFPTIQPKSFANTYGGPKGYVLEQARQEVLKVGITEEQLNQSGYRITTTFNKQAQDAAIAAVKSQGPKSGTRGLRIGLASVRVGTGEVVAIYGGADYLKDQYNNATQGMGQMGSTFKPFTLAAALEHGVTLSSSFSGMNKTKVQNYVVVNYSGHNYGKNITLLKATENSVNSTYVQVADQIGLDNVMNSAIRAGLPQDTVGLEPNLAATLGTCSPHVVDIAAAYATFGNRGVFAAPTYIKRIQTSAGDTLYQSKIKTSQAYTTQISDTVTYALQRVVKVGTGFAARSLGRPAAGKTGTTNDNKSALFAGYTPQIATAVMLTKDGKNGQPMTLSGTGGMDTVTGGSFPARIWTAYMKGALKGVKSESFPGLPKGVLDGLHATASPSPDAVIVPDLSSTQFIAETGGTLAAAQQRADEVGLVLNITPDMPGVDPTKVYVVVNSQSTPAFMTAFSGDIITVSVTTRKPR